jgi:hypothetical protein
MEERRKRLQEQETQRQLAEQRRQRIEERRRQAQIDKRRQQIAAERQRRLAEKRDQLRDERAQKEFEERRQRFVEAKKRRMFERRQRMLEEQRLEQQRIAEERRQRQYERRQRIAEERRLAEERIAELERLEQDRQIAAWEAEKQRILSLAESEGWNEGVYDAQVVARKLANAQAYDDAVETAYNEGIEQAMLRDQHAGYENGRLNAQKNESLLQTYLNGVESGKAIASEKANKEIYASEFNRLLQERMTSVPAAKDVISLKDLDTNEAAQGESFSESRSVNAISSPDVEIPAFKATGVSGVQSISTPSFSIGSNSASDYCQFVPAELSSSCISAYTGSYAEAYRSTYATEYRTTYVEVYNQVAKEAFDQGFSQKFADEYNEYMLTGVFEQGEVEGFEKAIGTESARVKKLVANDVAAYLRTSLLVKPVGISLVETNADGHFANGEHLTLSLNIHSLGSSPVTEGLIRVRLTKSVGVNAEKNAVAYLPELAANHSLQINNLFSMIVATSRSNKSILVEAVVEYKNEDNEFKQLSTFKVETSSTSPYLVTKLTANSKAVIGGTQTYGLELRNDSKLPSPAANLEVKSLPNLITFDSEGLTIPELAAGESTVVQVPAKIGAWYSSDIPLMLSAKTDSGIVFEGSVKDVAVDRIASLQLTVGGKPLESNFLQVKGGDRLVVGFGLANHSGSVLRNKFNVKMIRVSDKAIKSSANSNIGYGFEYVSLKGSKSHGVLSVDVPKSLSGTQQYVMYSLTVDGKHVHTPIVYIDIK